MELIMGGLRDLFGVNIAPTSLQAKIARMAKNYWLKVMPNDRVQAG